MKKHAWLKWDVYNPVVGNQCVRYELLRLRQSQGEQRMLSSSSFLSLFLTHSHPVFFPFTPCSLSTSPPSTPLCVSTHISDRPSGQQHLGSNEIQEWGYQRDLYVYVFVDKLYVMSICPVPQDDYGWLLFSSFAKDSNGTDDLFRICGVLAVIIFSEIKKSVKAASCPQAEIVVCWMHVLCPVNMICGLCFKVLPESFFFFFLLSSSFQGRRS